MDKMAKVLNHDLVDKARTVDQLCIGTVPGKMGPVQTKLLTYKRMHGAVFGVFEETGEDVQGEGSWAPEREGDTRGLQRGRRH